MVKTMKPINFSWRGHQYIFDYVPLIFLALITVALGKVNDLTRTSTDSVKLITDLNRQRTAAEMRALDAERKNSQPASGVNVIVISPDGKSRQQQIPARSYADVTQQL